MKEWDMNAADTTVYAISKHRCKALQENTYLSNHNRCQYHIEILCLTTIHTFVDD